MLKAHKLQQGIKNRFTSKCVYESAFLSSEDVFKFQYLGYVSIFLLVKHGSLSRHLILAMAHARVMCSKESQINLLL